MASITNKNEIKGSGELDLGRLLGELIDHRKLIISVTSLFTLLALIYALFATPVYQADALVQVEQKQANAILSNLSQLLPDSQPQSAAEIALLQSRMILGKTVDDLNLQTRIEPLYFPLFGKGWARLTNKNAGSLDVVKFYLSGANDEDAPDAEVRVIDKNHFEITVNDNVYKGTVGELLQNNDVIIKVDRINSEAGNEFKLTYYSRYKAIANLQENLSVIDKGKDTGMLTLSLSGYDPVLIQKIVDNIASNYLAQNIARQAAQDAKSLDFLNEQLPKVRSDLDLAESKLNEYRKKSDSVDLTLEAKAVLDQIVNVDNQLNELTFRESEISQLYTKEHPTYKALLEKRKTLQDEKNKLNKRVS
ncbi:Wzz/FepE/Etk N-terminal domain-containing protein, partial [Escherichia coli]